MKFTNRVFVIDDDEDDREMLKEALKDIHIEHSFIEADNGVEALAKLEKLLEENQLPCLVVLDLNMPRMDGKQTFLALKNHDKFSKIPVVIFSTSDSVLDKRFFQRHDTAYFVKPLKFTELKTTASRLINMCYHKSEKPN